MMPVTRHRSRQALGRQRAAESGGAGSRCAHLPDSGGARIHALHSGARGRSRRGTRGEVRKDPRCRCDRPRRAAGAARRRSPGRVHFGARRSAGGRRAPSPPSNADRVGPAPRVGSGHRRPRLRESRAHRRGIPRRGTQPGGTVVRLSPNRARSSRARPS